MAQIAVLYIVKNTVDRGDCTCSSGWGCSRWGLIWTCPHALHLDWPWGWGWSGSTFWGGLPWSLSHWLKTWGFLPYNATKGSLRDALGPIWLLWVGWSWKVFDCWERGLLTEAVSDPDSSQYRWWSQYRCSCPDWSCTVLSDGNRC